MYTYISKHKKRNIFTRSFEFQPRTQHNPELLSWSYAPDADADHRGFLQRSKNFEEEFHLLWLQAKMNQQLKDVSCSLL